MRQLTLITTTLLLATNAFATELGNFNQIKTAATQGNTLHIAIDFSQCRVLQGIAAAAVYNSIGVYTPQAIQIVQHAIVASFTHFTLNSPGLPNRPTLEFIKYRIDPRDILTVTSQPLDATNYSRIGEQTTFSCPLSTAAKIYTDV